MKKEQTNEVKNFIDNLVKEMVGENNAWDIIQR